MLITPRLVHVQKISDYRVHNVDPSLLNAVRVEFLVQDAFFDQALAY